MQGRRWVYVVAGWSGFAVMAIELLSGRTLAPDFGNSIYVWGAVITVFMLALAVGYLIGGQLSVLSPSLTKLGVILLAAAAALSPVLFLGDPVLNWIFDNMDDPRYGSLLGSSALFFLPTVVLGVVAPYAIRLLASDARVSGKSAGLLYFVSTFGSAAGTLATSFYLVLLFELNQLYLGLIGITAAIGLVTILIGRRTP